MVGREVWGDIKNKRLKAHLRKCRDNVCECLSAYFDKLNGGGDGMADRFARMMDENAVRTGIETHAQQIDGRQRALKLAKKIYDDQGCGDPGAPAHTSISEEALRNMGRPIPTAEDWEEEHGRPMPEGDYQPGQHKSVQAPEDEPGNSILDWEYWEELTGLTGAALVAYVIISEGSRLFPPRNAIPIP